MKDEKLGKEKLSQIRKDNRRKAILGFLLVVAIGFFVWRHIGLGLPVIGLLVQEKGTQLETEGPEYMVDTEVKPLKVETEGFEAVRKEDNAVIKVRNEDEIDGEVEVRLYCKDGKEQGREKKEIASGEEEIFVFEKVEDCDLDYLIEPELVRKRVNRTVVGDEH